MFSEELIRSQLIDSPLENVSQDFIQATNRVMSQRRHGDLDQWISLIESLPETSPSVVQLDQGCIEIGSQKDVNSRTRETIKASLMSLAPWRKGPFSLFGIDIDAEWRSDLKWARLNEHITSLQDRCVLDVGCGNGYYIARMLGAGAEFVLGIEPTQLFVVQFYALQKYLSNSAAMILPLRCEELPLDALENQGIGFDTVFSMGILYHRKQPEIHLEELYRALRPGGEVVVETLVMEDEYDNLVPDSTYAKMRNVWLIPTTNNLIEMLAKVGFHNIVNTDISATTLNEQRKTEWMKFESLADFLDKDDRAKTIEGYPAPQRVIVVATK